MGLGPIPLIVVGVREPAESYVVTGVKVAGKVTGLVANELPLRGSMEEDGVT